MDKNNKYNIKFDESADAISSHECTGLIPSGSADEERLEEYREIYDFGLPPHDVYHKEKYFRK